MTTFEIHRIVGTGTVYDGVRVLIDRDAIENGETIGNVCGELRLVQIPVKHLDGFPDCAKPIPLVTGYICKRCNGPAPAGVGYATNHPATGTLDSCPCGYSRSGLASDSLTGKATS